MNFGKSLLILLFILVSYFVLSNCNKKDTPYKIRESKARFTKVLKKANKCIIVLVDGPRWSETGGNAFHNYQQHLYNDMFPRGITFNNFYNQGYTWTNPGHAAILTGMHENITNDGLQLATNPSLIQLFRSKEKVDSSKTWIITSKDKLEIFKTCANSSWSNRSTPSVDCGVNGLGTGYREDSVTFAHTMEVLKNQKPDFLFVAFKEPDYSGHQGNWNNYLSGLVKSDEYYYKIYQYLNTDPYYKNQTLMVITNDHGRHLNSVADGFISHGDDCAGCRHINCYMMGPNLKVNQYVNTIYNQLDLNRTIINYFQLDSSFSQGKVMTDIYKP